MHIIRAKIQKKRDFEARNNIAFEAVFDRKIYLSGTPLGFYGGSGTL